MPRLPLKRGASSPPLDSEGTTLLILYKHQIVGQVNYRWDNPHQVTFKTLDLLAKTKTGKDACLAFLIPYISAEANPVLFVYEAKDKALGKRAGFQRKKGAGDDRELLLSQDSALSLLLAFFSGFNRRFFSGESFIERGRFFIGLVIDEDDLRDLIKVEHLG